VFVERDVRIPTAAVLEVVQRPADVLRATLARGAPLLQAGDAGR
jgi:hypothetical protein